MMSESSTDDPAMRTRSMPIDYYGEDTLKTSYTLPRNLSANDAYDVACSGRRDSKFFRVGAMLTSPVVTSAAEYSCRVQPHHVATRALWVLSRAETWSYAVGHVLNDLCAACWFTYLLVFLTDVKGLSSASAGIVMFCGQGADGFATPLVGICSDKSNGIPSLGLGRRKLWYVMGTILVVCCFSMVWVVDIPEMVGTEKDGWVEVAYYALAASIFNVGWASVQVSHMAFVPDLTPVPCERVQLNSYRYGFTVLSNVAVYIVFLAFVSLMQPRGDQSEAKYRGVGLSVLLLGAATSCVFLTGVKEQMGPHLGDDGKEDEGGGGG